MKRTLHRLLFAATILVFALAALSNTAIGAVQTKSVLTGIVRADGVPLAGVQVSDGLQIVTTDQKGRYSMQSDKSEGLVFIITPSNYVAKSADGLQPAFWASLTKGEGQPEQHDFELRKEDQNNYTMVFMTDVHLTNSNVKQDLSHFKKLALPALKEIQAKYAQKGPVYSLNLGDLSHDLFWYEFDFSVAGARDFLAKEKFPMLLYSLPGNHDNDGAVTGANVDFDAGWLYRKTFGPTYYSMNIGGAHWIMMDDIVYKNTPNTGKKAPGIAGARDYISAFTAKQMEWLRQDLAAVDSATPVYLCTHAPILYPNKRGFALTRGTQLDSLDLWFQKFSKVNIFSGHSHKMIYTKNSKYPRFEQCVLPATSGNMWTTSNGFQTICTDGTDAGFVVGNYQGKNATYTYHTEAYGVKVLRAYDMNSVGNYYRTDDGIRQLLQMYPTRLNYGLPEYANAVYVNYWNLKPGERVEMYENGHPLSVEKVENEDPLYNVSYYVPVLLESPKFKSGDANVSNTHMFAAKAKTANAPVEIRIVDAYGKVVHTEPMTRPKKFDKDMK